MQLTRALNTKSTALYAAYCVILVSLLAGLPAFAVWLGLPPEGDAVDYRVPLVKWVAQSGRWPSWPWTMVEDYPSFGEVLMALLYRIDPRLMRLVPYLAYAGLGLIGAGLMKRINPRVPPVVAIAWILALRPITFQSNLLMVDNLSSAFLLASLFFLLEKRTVVAAIFCALALATRYSAWPMATVLLLLSGISVENWKRFRLSECIIFGLVASIGALPFMVRNLWLNGNPFFPLLGGLFGTGADASYYGYGRGKTLFAFLLLPYDLLYTNSFVRPLFDYVLGKLFYVQLGACVFAAAILKMRRKILIPKRDLTPHLQIILFCILCTVAWFLGSQQLRFLVPVLLVLNLYMLSTLWSASSPVIVAGVTILGLMSALSVQSNSIRIALGKAESPFAASAKEALNCLASLPAGETIGLIDRDGFLGFADVSFRYIPPHSYAVAVPSEERGVNFIYSSRPISGFVPFGARGCLQKRVDSTANASLGK